MKVCNAQENFIGTNFHHFLMLPRILLAYIYCLAGCLVFCIIIVCLLLRKDLPMKLELGDHQARVIFLAPYSTTPGAWVMSTH